MNTVVVREGSRSGAHERRGHFVVLDMRTRPGLCNLRPTLLAFLLGVAWLLVLVPGRKSWSQSNSADIDGARYPVSRIYLEYANPHPKQLPVESLMEIRVELGVVDDEYVNPRQGVQTTELTLGNMAGLPSAFRASAIRAISESIVQHFNDRGLVGVAVSPRGVDWTTDRRPRGRTDLRFVITTGVVETLRTRATGERFPQNRENNEAHQWIKHRSPVQPGDLVRLDLLDAYSARLSRHPGRWVDVAVSRGGEEETSELAFIVNEKRPWRAFAQASNTGTKETDKWRYHLGYVDSQLLGLDDILRLHYITAGFDDSHAVLGSYEAPFVFGEPWRWRLRGAYSDYTASEVGVSDADFSGNSWTTAGTFIWNVYQNGRFFLDLVAGATAQDIEVDNEIFGIDLGGRETLVLPHAGVEFERFLLTGGTKGSVLFEGPNLTGADESDLEDLGRTEPDEDWVVLRWDLSHYFYLEPLLDREAWENTMTPETSTLAHEIAVLLRGQYSFDQRLIPNLQQVAGGLESVRGYPQSEAAGDSGVLASVEYRFHVPRVLPIQRDAPDVFGRPFRLAPRYAYDRPDWDLILRAFVDFGATFYGSSDFGEEEDETLLGTGLGAELRLKENYSFRLDWGVALIDMENDEAEAGDNELHLMATIAF